MYEPNMGIEYFFAALALGMVGLVLLIAIADWWRELPFKKWYLDHKRRKMTKLDTPRPDFTRGEEPPDPW